MPAPEQPELFLKKLQQCCTVFDFMDTLSDLKMKEYKRSTLNELVDYVTVSRGYLTEQAYPEVVKMVRRGAAWTEHTSQNNTDVQTRSAGLRYLTVVTLRRENIPYLSRTDRNKDGRHEHGAKPSGGPPGGRFHWMF